MACQIGRRQSASASCGRSTNSEKTPGYALNWADKLIYVAMCLLCQHFEVTKTLNNVCRYGRSVLSLVVGLLVDA